MRWSVGAPRVTPDHPPGVIPRDPGAGDAARHGGGRPARQRRSCSASSSACARPTPSWRRRRAGAGGGAAPRSCSCSCSAAGSPAASVIAIWTRATVLNTDRYVDTMAPIARSPAVQKAVADKLYTRITGAIDFDALARDVLPERADVLAPAIEVGADTAIRQGLDRLVASDRFTELWDKANRRSHETVVGAAHHRQVEPAHARRRRRLPRSQPGRRPRQGPAARARLRPRRRRHPGRPSTGASRC